MNFGGVTISGHPQNHWNKFMKAALYWSIVILAISALAQPSKAPVPPEFLEANSLRVKEANFVLPSPGPEWQWDLLKQRSPDPNTVGVFVANNPQTHEYFVVTALRGVLTHIDDEFARGALTAVRERSPEAAMSLQHDFVDFPLPHTLHYSFVSSYPNLGSQHTYAYTIATGSTVSIMAVTPSSTEPVSFTQFVKSLRTIGPVPAEAPSRKNVPGSMAGYFAILFITAGIAGLVNRTTGRSINSFKCAAGLVAVILVADLAFALYLISENHVNDAYSQGYLVGGVLVNGFVPLIVGIVLARYVRHREDMPPPAPAA